MSKHKKTRREKMLADMRHKLYALQAQNFSSVNYQPAKPFLEKKIITPRQSFTVVSKTSSYLYLKRDISKSLIVTFAIVVFQIIFSFLLKKHLVTLPGMSY